MNLKTLVSTMQLATLATSCELILFVVCQIQLGVCPESKWN